MWRERQSVGSDAWIGGVLQLLTNIMNHIKFIEEKRAAMARG